MGRGIVGYFVEKFWIVGREEFSKRLCRSKGFSLWFGMWVFVNFFFLGRKREGARLVLGKRR